MKKYRGHLHALFSVHDGVIVQKLSDKSMKKTNKVAVVVAAVVAVAVAAIVQQM